MTHDPYSFHFALKKKKKKKKPDIPNAYSMFKASFPERHSVQNVACEQALQGTLATGQEKEGELATTSLEFKHRKS